MERISKVRAIALLLIFAAILSLYSIRLFNLQIVETDGKSENLDVYVTQTRGKAARGDILDRNGNILVGNRASYDLVFNHYVITSYDNTNESLMKLIDKTRELGITYMDHFPITKDRPFEYTLTEYTTAWQGYFQKFLQDRSIDSDITAPLLMQRMRERYKIPEEWSDVDARAVIGLRYEFDLRGVVNLASYVFMEDVSDEHLSALLELNTPGLMVESSTVREYYTSYAAHILGTMGAMTNEQWQKVNQAYKDGVGKEYYMDAQIGQSGFEAAFEQYLHGVDGLRRDTVDKNGAIISQEYYEGKEPHAGNNVETTIDINLQIIAEDALADVIDWLKNPEDSKTDKNQEQTGRDVEGAAVVVMKVKTGEILACASYPTYNPQTYNEDYNEILEADFDPLFNRAFHATYAPGSSFKMVTLYAAMELGGGRIKPSRLFEYGETVNAQGKYREYENQGFAPACLLWNAYGRMHGVIDAAKALEVSCNYFFYYLADWFISGATLDEAAKGFGLGEKTGIELDEAVGMRANAENKAKLYTGAMASWGVGDKLNAAIGQSENRLTPLQLCVYVSTVANRGVRMKATFLNRVVASDYRTLILENEPTVASTLKMSNATYSTIVQGMKQVISGPSGTARNTMTNMSVEVAAKTGTAETGRLGSDDGSFVCFAPADDPEIAIAVFGEKAAHGSTLGRVAKDVIEYYFYQAQASSVVTHENQLS